MTVKKGQLIDLSISDIAFGGKGLAKIDGFAVFVDQTVPLDQVTARIVKKKKNFAEARIVEILVPSPFRITPPCPYSGLCGGCKWQFLRYEKQLEYKRQHVIDSLEHIAGIRGVTVHPTIPSKRLFGYRNKMEFTCADRRWLLPDEMDKENVDKGLALGLHVPGTFYKVLDIHVCLLQPDLGNEILGDIRTFIKNSNAPVYNLHSQIGFWRFAMLRHSASDNRWMVNIISATEDRKTVQPLADLLAGKYPEIVSVVNNITSRKAGVAVGEYEICLWGAPVLMDQIGPYRFEISPNSFFQTNTRGAESLYETVRKYAKLTGTETIVDLYSGTGTISIYLSNSAKEVIGIEIVESSVKDAVNNCRKNRISNCRFIQGDIKNALSRVSACPDVMVIDPPRAGIHKNVVKQILEIAPPRIVYVSCNPATMARDLQLIKDHYEVEEVQPVDMFPHTFHIESVAGLKKK
jgi:23S rRNA (uracil1939-C5)-methyltransferase